MGKLTTYIILLSVTIATFHFFGLIEDTPISILLNLVLDPQSIINTSFYTKVLTAIGLIASVGIVIGLYVAQKTELIIKATLAPFLLAMGWDLIVVFNQIALLHIALATLLISPLVIVWFLTVIEWIGGKD